MIQGTVNSLLPARLFGLRLHEMPGALARTASDVLGLMPEVAAEPENGEESPTLRTVGWISAALGAVALGLFVGRELRQRYKFNRRTPYDFYAHSGDEPDGMEFGVGI